jgi:hypothetical protein
MQMSAMKSAEKAKEDPSAYFDFSEKILNENLISLDLIHIASETHITKREELEYLDSESLIALICGIVVGGEKLGKKIV